ncbi:MAG: DUF2868 domain-containing protein [Burkholderiaceae bacterium]
MDERRARQLVLVQAFDAADSPLWTPEDRDWASRLAAQTAPAAASPEALLAERAHHAVQRLAPRDAGVRRWIERSPWRWRWLFGAAAVGAAFGLLADLLGREPHIDLLAPPVWAIVAWNLVVYAWLVVHALRSKPDRPGLVRRTLTRWWQRAAGRGPLRQASLRWARASGGLTLARATLVMHLAAAALAGGVMAGLYLRGLVFDYRVGWQSTFLAAETVHTLLGFGMAPASALTGIGVPDAAGIAALRITPQAPQASASAAPWIHLYAATLLLVVVLPRLALAAVAAAQAWVRSRRVELPLQEDPALAALHRYRRHGPVLVRVLPYAAPPAAQAALGLRALLAEVYGDDMQLQIGATIAVGDEDAGAERAGDGEPALLVGLAELGSTPEVEHHGRFVRALRTRAPGAALLWIVDEADFVRRFAALPARLEERRVAWRDWAAREGLRCLSVDLGAPLADATKAAIDTLFAT